MGLNKAVAGRLADERLTEWTSNASLEDLVQMDLHNSSNEHEVVAEDGLRYTVRSTVWREEHDPAIVLNVQVSEAGKRALFRSVLRQARRQPDGSYTSEF